ncbi:hypothetical protein CRG98_006047 [Punica granatum]|uniref:Uncharacterized protein n=1 Tax=Punica granatum TaxID=22663 RepID=A0A2I0L017_PUNGR|nr:hypothetical protein CRG98_006047 [Punica granatum]
MDPSYKQLEGGDIPLSRPRSVRFTSKCPSFLISDQQLSFARGSSKLLSMNYSLIQVTILIVHRFHIRRMSILVHDRPVSFRWSHNMLGAKIKLIRVDHPRHQQQVDRQPPRMAGHTPPRRLRQLLLHDLLCLDLPLPSAAEEKMILSLCPHSPSWRNHSNRSRSLGTPCSFFRTLSTGGWLSRLLGRGSRESSESSSWDHQPLHPYLMETMKTP